MPETIYALVDYDNQRPPRFGSKARSGRPPSLRDHEDYLHVLINAILDLRGQFSEAFLELRLRLYGGWTSLLPGERSEVGDLVSSAVANWGRTSRTRRTRLFIELADALLVAPEELLVGTFRATRWRGATLRFFPQPPECKEGPGCSHIRALFDWSRGRCPRRPSCPVQSIQVASSEGQKLVDAMLICDTISAATHFGAHVLTVSMDDDVIPGVLSAHLLGGRVSLVRFGKRDPSVLDPVLARNGVNIIDLPALGG